MNNFINLGENEFLKSIRPMKPADKESLLRLLSREVLLAKEDLNRYEEFLKLAKNKKNDLECFKNEQNIKDTQRLVEELGRKLFICQKEIDASKNSKNNLSGKIFNSQDLRDGPSNSVNNTNNNNNNNNLDSLPLGTKSLINNFEKISVSPADHNVSQSKDTKNITNSNKKPIANIQSSQPRGSLKSAIKVEDTFSFRDIKLKKVGLPPDAKEVDQNSFIEENKVIAADQPNQHRKLSLQTSIPNGTYSVVKSSSIDLGMSSPLKGKDRFHNPNKEIQIAIQNEIKDLKLKKLEDNSLVPAVKCTIDEMSLGRFNFVNEQSLNNSTSSTVRRMSASKSMPSIHRITNSASEKGDSYIAPIACVMEKSALGENNFNDNDVSSSMGNWDSLALLKELYDFEKQLNEVPTSSADSATNISGFIEMLPGLSNNSWNTNLWKRRFATILKGELKIFENQTSRSVLNCFPITSINIKNINEVTVELYDSRGLHSTIRFPKPIDCTQWVEAFRSHLLYKTSEIVPRLHDSVACKRIPKILIMDIGSCSIRAGLLKIEPTFPKLYFPNLAALSRKTETVVEIGFEAVNSNEECNIIRPFKPDTTIEDIAFTSGTVESIFRKTCSLLNANPKEYVIMLSLPHNVAEATRTKLADVLLMRLNVQGISMCGQSLLALQAYGEETGILVDIGHRTEVLPVIHGIVQRSSIMRGLYGGHLIQIALSHLLPFETHSLTDFLLVRYIMEKACVVAEDNDKNDNSNERVDVKLANFKLPTQIPESVSLKGRDRSLPVEGFFNPDIYHLDTLSLPGLIAKSIQSCPMDNRRDLCQSICLSGAASQLPGLCGRLERELKLLLPNNCDIKIRCSPNRAHFSYIGACVVALSEGFSKTVVNRIEWEESRTVSLKKWDF